VLTPVVLLKMMVPDLLLEKVLELLLRVLLVRAHAVHAAVPAAAAPAPVASPGRVRWPDNAGSRDGSANAELPADRLDCNNVPADILA
jgi:hypothetical protein